MERGDAASEGRQRPKDFKAEPMTDLEGRAVLCRVSHWDLHSPLTSGLAFNNISKILMV